jgi:ribosomal protein S12 methylthiotransferase accessory factor YcaO
MISDEELESRLLPRLAEFGISRLADTTGLDRTGVPTASAVKPGTSDVIWVYSGKGLSRSRARAVAVMECLERNCSLWPERDENTVVATAQELAEATNRPIWPVGRFTERTFPGADTMRIPWTTASAVDAAETVWVPADLVYNGHRPRGVNAASPFRYRTSNGLGAGFDLESALVHALLEVAERDIVSRCELAASHTGVAFLAALAGRAGIDSSWLAEEYRDDTEHGVTIRPDTLPTRARELHARLCAAGLDPVVKALPSDFGLPAYGVAALESITADSVLACAGYAAALDPEQALLAAMLELAQTRATDLQGAREDRHEPEKRRVVGGVGNHWLATPGRPVPYAEARDSFGRGTGTGTGTDLDRVVAALRGAGLTDLAFVRFPAPPGIHVVRVLVPGAETWHATGGQSRLGPRASREADHG